jgi:hypothetical protein
MLSSSANLLCYAGARNDDGQDATFARAASCRAMRMHPQEEQCEMQQRMRAKGRGEIISSSARRLPLSFDVDLFICIKTAMTLSDLSGSLSA